MLTKENTSRLVLGTPSAGIFIEPSNFEGQIIRLIFKHPKGDYEVHLSAEDNKTLIKELSEFDTYKEEVNAN